MRITNKMLSNNFLSDLNTNLQNMQTLQKQMTSGKLFSKPSDNPFSVSRAMELHTSINTNTMYNENIKDTINWLDTTDKAAGQIGDVFQRVRELLVNSGDAAYSPEERQKIKDEVNQDVSQLSQILNTSFDGKYVFGGTRGTSKPTDAVTNATTGNTDLVYVNKDGTTLDPVVTPTAAQYTMIKTSLQVEVSQGVTMKYNVSANEIMQYGSDPSTDDIRLLLQRITNHLDGNNDAGTATDANATSYLTGKDLNDVDAALNNILTVRSQVGAKQNRMDSAQTQNTDMNANMTEILSKTEDIDITQKTMEYATAQTVYLASLQTSAKVIQPTLMDYLR
ncbi:MAG: flagellar hook-associated protein 3 [Clostridiaceae bacterium]|jgi:flagellar hook-associated protein 3 FlgL|nr:flagellar hook-associated protein 3 [Clostridiaceae bacterium]